jgi:hypothetical protein
MPNPAQYGLKDSKTINEKTHPVTEVEYRMVMAMPEYRDLMRLVIVKGVTELRKRDYNNAVAAFVTGR